MKFPKLIFILLIFSVYSFSSMIINEEFLNKLKEDPNYYKLVKTEECIQKKCVMKISSCMVLCFNNKTCKNNCYKESDPCIKSCGSKCDTRTLENKIIQCNNKISEKYGNKTNIINYQNIAKDFEECLKPCIDYEKINSLYPQKKENKKNIFSTIFENIINIVTTIIQNIFKFFYNFLK